MGKIEGLKAFINPNPNPINITIWDAILVGGLYGKGYKPLAEQVAIFKIGYGKDKNVRAFNHDDGGGNGRGLSPTFLEFLKNNPFLPIFLFSAGNKKAAALSDNENVNVKELFFIEFYGSDENVKGIKHAIEKGALSSNVFTGGGIGTGEGLIKDSVDSKGAAKTIANKISYTYNGVTKYEWNGHWDALRAVGELKNKV